MPENLGWWEGAFFGRGTRGGGVIEGVLEKCPKDHGPTDAVASVRADNKSLSPPIPHTLFTPTTSFDDDLNLPTAGRGRSRPSNARCVYPSSKHCERFVRHPASSSRLWIRQRPPHYDSSTSPHASRIQASDSRLSRTRWPTTRIMSTSGEHVVTCVRYSTGD